MQARIIEVGTASGHTISISLAAERVVLAWTSRPDARATSTGLSMTLCSKSRRSMTQAVFDGPAHATELSVAWRKRFIIARMLRHAHCASRLHASSGSHVNIFPA